MPDYMLLDIELGYSLVDGIDTANLTTVITQNQGSRPLTHVITSNIFGHIGRLQVCKAYGTIDEWFDKDDFPEFVISIATALDRLYMIKHQ